MKVIFCAYTAANHGEVCENSQAGATFSLGLTIIYSRVVPKFLSIFISENTLNISLSYRQNT